MIIMFETFDLRDYTDEFEVCKTNPVHFINNYIKVVKQGNRDIPCKAYKHQEYIVRELMNRNRVITVNCRQSGTTTIGCGFLLWYVMFNKEKNAVLCGISDADVGNKMQMIREMHESLPHWMRLLCFNYRQNKREMYFNNLSMIHGVNMATLQVKGTTIDFAFIDNFAHITSEQQDNVISSIMPAIPQDGKVLISSSAGMVNTPYHKMWEYSTQMLNDFYPIRVSFQSIGEDEVKKSLLKAKNMLGENRWREEYECEFGE